VRPRADRRLVACALLAAALATLAGCDSSGSAARPSPSRAGGTVVWAIGDGADGGAASIRLARRVARMGLDRLLYLGDVYESGTAAEFAQHYAPAYGRFASRTAPTPGNHEWPNRAQGYDPYWRAVKGRPPRPWYGFSVAGWRILSLNSEAPHDAGSPQLRWLRRALGGGGDCRIAFWHRPRFSAGLVHGDAPDVQPFWDALGGRARIVVNGHEHDLQRFAARRGVTELISGAGGHGHYPLGPHPGLAFGDATHDGALRLVLRRGRADWSFVAADGRTLDSGFLRCRRR
jgi:hypothetical protein